MNPFRYERARDASSAVALLAGAPGGVVRDVRIALGGVAPVPWQTAQAEAMLRTGHRGGVWSSRRGRAGRCAATARQRIQGPARPQHPCADTA